MHWGLRVRPNSANCSRQKGRPNKEPVHGHAYPPWPVVLIQGLEGYPFSICQILIPIGLFLGFTNRYFRVIGEK